MVEGAVHEALSHVEESTEFNVYLHPDESGYTATSKLPVIVDATAGRTEPIFTAPTT